MLSLNAIMSVEEIPSICRVFSKCVKTTTTTTISATTKSNNKHDLRVVFYFLKRWAGHGKEHLAEVVICWYFWSHEKNNVFLDINQKKKCLKWRARKAQVFSKNSWPEKSVGGGVWKEFNLKSWPYRRKSKEK